VLLRARIVAEVVSNEDLCNEWKQETEGMAGCIRYALRFLLAFGQKASLSTISMLGPVYEDGAR
jgi:aspartate/tyrosine/aromatic aminotransferase